MCIRDRPKTLNLVTRDEQAKFMVSRTQFKPLYEVMKDAKEPFDGGNLATELRVGLGDACLLYTSRCV